MTVTRMHQDEVVTDADLVRRLIAGQFPQWAHLPVERVQSAGTDNAIYRLGDELAVRMPRRPGAVAQVEKDARWLPLLAPRLPLAIPVPVATGRAAEGYPWRWTVCPWLHGTNATLDRIAEPRELMADLAAFINALRAIDTTDGPLAGAHNFYRGVPLRLRDSYVRRALATLDGTIDVAAATAAWETALRAPDWRHEPVWLHGDLAPGNLVARDGRLAGVIDFGCLGVGEPACELIVAWNLLPAALRDDFREAIGADDATWARGRGWALAQALIALPYYRDTNPTIVAASKALIRELLADMS